jgi:hypothetical protein
MAERCVAIYIINAAWMACIVTGVATLLLNLPRLSGRVDCVASV